MDVRFPGFLEIFGLGLAIIDFFELTNKVEQWVDRLRERMIAELRRLHYYKGGYFHYPTIYANYRTRLILGALAVSIINWGPLIAGGILESRGDTSMIIPTIALIGIAIINGFVAWPVFFFLNSFVFFLYTIAFVYPIYWIMRVLDMPKKGTIGTLGIVLAAIGLFLE